ncbi:MAG: hypothetical protein J0L64_00935 [Acidobacteria bacterium]|nr:hypothetical protein [Acidobacteriota bacterium]
MAHRRTGEPVGRAMVYLTRADGSQGLSRLAGADGKFVFEKVARGVYRVSAERRGFLRGEYGARRYGQRGGLITLTDGQEMKGADVKLDPQSVIAGQILDENGEPMPSVQVMAWKRIPAAGRQGGPAGNDSTDDRGEFRIAGLGPGKYYLQATVFRRGMGMARNMRRVDEETPDSYVSTYFPGTTEMGSATPVELGVGQEFLGLSMQVKKLRVYRVTGVVSGAEMRSVRVMAVPKSRVMMGGGGFNGGVRSDGGFELTGLTAGTYTIMAMRGGGAGGSLSAKTQVEVGSADVEGVQLVFGPTFAVQGTVKVEGGEKLEMGNLRLQLMNEDASFASPGGRVNPDGSFSIEGVAPDRYRLAAVYMGRGYYVKSSTMGGQDVRGKVIDLTAGVAGRMELVLGNKPASVSGTVSKAAAESLPGMVVLVAEGAEVEALDSGPMPVNRWEASVDQNGAFHVDNIPPGEYRVYAFEEFDANEGYDAEFLKKLERSSEKVKLGERETKTVSLKQIPAGDGLL